MLNDVTSGGAVRSMLIERYNRYEPLTHLDYSNVAETSSSNSDMQNNRANVNVDFVGSKAKQTNKKIGSSYKEIFKYV